MIPIPISSKAVTIGPTWQRDADGNFITSGPTLGWQIAEWCYDYLCQPDGDHAGEPWVFTDEQLRWLTHWYAVDSEGRWRWRRGALVRQKGWG